MLSGEVSGLPGISVQRLSILNGCLEDSPSSVWELALHDGWAYIGSLGAI